MVNAHKHTITLLDLFETESKYLLVTELAQGGELFERLAKRGPYSEKTASRVMSQIYEAIKHLHDQGICHRDLKPENILLTTKKDDADIKVSDFGLAVKMQEAERTEWARGTWEYWS